MLIDLKNKNVSGAKVEYVCECVDISLNKNSVVGDTSATNPGGIRIGTCALTTRNLKEDDFKIVGDFINECVELCLRVQNDSGKKLVDFKKVLHENYSNDIELLKNNVNEFASKFDFYDEKKNLLLFFFFFYYKFFTTTMFIYCDCSDVGFQDLWSMLDRNV